MIASRKELSAGAIFIAFGLIYGYQAATGMQVGSVSRMGPGFFPLALSIILVLIGVGVALRGLRPGGKAAMEAVPWRPLLFISASTLVFAVLANPLGMLPVTFLSTFVAAFARREVRPLQAFVMAAGIAVFCSLLFTYGLGLPLPVLGSWFGG